MDGDAAVEVTVAEEGLEYGTGSRAGLPGSVPSIDEIDMLLPGRGAVDSAGSSRLPEKGGGGGGTCDRGVWRLCCAWEVCGDEGGSI